MIWITTEDVIRRHAQIIRTTGGLDGLRDKGALESAIAAPMQTFGGKELYPGALEKIARLGYGLARNHAFVDGNKRIGALMVQLLLKWNGYALELHNGELSDMFISIADGTSSEEALIEWIHEHLQEKIKGEG